MEILIVKLLICIFFVVKSSGKSMTKSNLQHLLVTQCCAANQHYNLKSDSCYLPNTTINIKQPVLPFFRDSPLNKSLYNYKSITKANLQTCVSSIITTKEFKLFDNGSVFIEDIQQKLQPADYCLNEIKGQQFVVRYCAPDPCYRTNCVHKCCPEGMIRNLTSNRCQKTNRLFQVNFTDESGQVVHPDAGSYTFQYGHVPRCALGVFSLKPDVSPEDKFYILPNGQLYVIAFPEDKCLYKDYCIDDFIAKEDSSRIARRALICIRSQTVELPDNKVVFQVFPYLFILSSVFLVITFLVYAVIHELHNIHGVSIMCHVASLATTYIGLATIQLNPSLSDRSCVSLAFVVHFAFLAAFTWLNVMSFDIWWTFRDLRPPSNLRRDRNHLGRKFAFYSIYAWGVPLFIVVFGQILEQLPNLPRNIVKPDFGRFKCWFTDKKAELYFLYGPISLVIFSNIVFFVMTATLLYRASINSAMASKTVHTKQKFRVIGSLFILMGVPWLMEVISFAVGGSRFIWMATDILNIFTGVFMFVITVCKSKVWKLIKAKFSFLERFS